MSQAIWIVAAIAAGLALLGLVVALVLSRVRRKLRRMIRQRFDRTEMVQASGANLIGQRSRERGGVRGNGVLVLSRRELWFGLAVPEREQRIPIERIRSVSLPRSFMGRSIFREILCVRFEGPEGEDEIAWAVREPEKWRQAIELLRASL